MPTENALRIARKWVDRLGWGFHPDTRGRDYTPRMSAREIADYDSDIDALHGEDCCPYEAGLVAMGVYTHAVIRIMPDLECVPVYCGTRDDCETEMNRLSSEINRMQLYLREI